MPEASFLAWQQQFSKLCAPKLTSSDEGSTAAMSLN
jgi:hypothetical protein